MQVIRLTGVTKSYGKGAPALKNVSFSVTKGEFLFLTGPSGAGKSTLLKLIYMGTRPTDGEVRVSGYASGKIHRREIPHLRRRLGIIFQDFRLLKNRTARENVAFALEVTGASKSAIGPKVQRVLNAVGLGRKADRFPNELSGGEQQRVAIARALVNDPFILLADEPTGNLDTRTSLEILRILREINSMGMAVMLATHDYTLLSEYPEARVLHLVEGALVSDTANPTVRAAAAPAVTAAGEKPARPRAPETSRTAGPRVAAPAAATPTPATVAAPAVPPAASPTAAAPARPAAAPAAPPLAAPPAAPARPAVAAPAGQPVGAPAAPGAGEPPLGEPPAAAAGLDGTVPADVWTVDDLPEVPTPLPPRTSVPVPAPAGEPRLDAAVASAQADRERTRQPAGQSRN
jgi:cell division transport system ATP-binding protein